MMKKTKIAGIIGIGAAVALISGELIARYALGLGNPPLSTSHETIEYLYQPNQDVSRFGNRFLVNQYGMRSEKFPPEKKSSAETRIMVFGDSVINGGNLTDHSNLATTLLQQQLSQASSDPVIVGNISAGSWGLGNWLAYAKEYGFFEADIVVLQISSHDWKDNPKFKPLNPNTHPQNQPISAFTEGITRYLPRYLPDFSTLQEENEQEENQPSQAQTEQGLRDLKTFLEMAQQNAQQVIVFQHLTQSELKSGELEKGHYAIADLCQDLRIKTVSLQPYFQAGMAEKNLYRDDIHPNDNGQQVIAEAMREELKPLVSQ